MSLMVRAIRPVILLAVFLFPLRSYAIGDSLIVTLKSGHVVTIALSDVQKITFDSSLITPEAVQTGGSSTSGLKVFGNYPNPSHLSTNIEFFTPKAGKVSITFYDATGNLVRVIGPIALQA